MASPYQSAAQLYTAGSTFRKDPRQPPALSGTPYRVIAQLGSGGMGAVYLVEHVELGKQFVLKMLRRGRARPEWVARLRAEQRALGRIDHPNIVKVTDAGTTDEGDPYFVMEHLHGQTLRSLLDLRGRLAWPVASGLAAQMLDGLAAAHAIGIVHRDVKPSNVFVSRAGHVTLLDFGIAKCRAPAALALTRAGTTLGTPRYMAPEQIRREGVDGRADVYAVGLLLWEMVSGADPLCRLTRAEELLSAHVHEPLPRLASRQPDVPPELDDVLAAMLAKKPEQRPQSARQAAELLRAAVPDAAYIVQQSVVSRSVHEAPTVSGRALPHPASAGSERGDRLEWRGANSQPGERLLTSSGDNELTRLWQPADRGASADLAGQVSGKRARGGERRSAEVGAARSSRVAPGVAGGRTGLVAIAGLGFGLVLAGIVHAGQGAGQRAVGGSPGGATAAIVKLRSVLY